MTKCENWLVMLIKEIDDGIYTLTICEDEYVFDNKKHKLFVLNKATVETLNKLMNKYKNHHLSDELEPKNMVKFNGDTKFFSNDQDLFFKVIELVYKGDNIRHPSELLDPVMALIKELHATGKLDAMIQADGMDDTVDKLISSVDI